MALPHPSALSVFSLTTYPVQSKSRILQSKKCAVRLKELRGAGGRGRDAHQIGVCK